MPPTIEEVQEHVQKTVQEGRRIRRILAWGLFPYMVFVSILTVLVCRFLEDWM